MNKLVILLSYLAVWQPHYFGFLTNIYPGIYSLVGAVSFLGGVKRMILSFTVILIECTNETSLGLPILLTLMVSLIMHRHLEANESDSSGGSDTNVLPP